MNFHHHLMLLNFYLLHLLISHFHQIHLLFHYCLNLYFHCQNMWFVELNFLFCLDCLLGLLIRKIELKILGEEFHILILYFHLFLYFLVILFLYVLLYCYYCWCCYCYFYYLHLMFHSCLYELKNQLILNLFFFLNFLFRFVFFLEEIFYKNLQIIYK